MARYTKAYVQPNTPMGKKLNVSRETLFYKNKAGVYIRPSELEKMNKQSRQANKQREKIIKMLDPLEMTIGGEKYGQTAEQLRLMGKPSDFVPTKKHADFNKFKDQKSLERYLANLEKTSGKNYAEKRVSLYKKNLIQAGKNTGVFGRDKKSKEIIKAINTMTPKEFMKFSTAEQSITFEFVYGGQQGNTAKEKRSKMLKAIQKATKKGG